MKARKPGIPVVTRIVRRVESAPPAEKYVSSTIPSSAARYLYVLKPIPVNGYFSNSS